MKLGCAALAGLCFASLATQAGDKDGQPGFVPPAPGTYALQHIARAPEGVVVDVDRRAKPLSRFTTGKITLLSLIYTRCGDGRGCPLASYRLQQVKRSADQDPRLRERLRLVSLSFDPESDTPEVMRAYGDGFVPEKKGVPWHFLTTRSRLELKPLLDGFGQDVWTPADPSADAARSLPHVLRVFLLDRRGAIREIYSTSFLEPRVVVNDVKTLLLEEGVRTD